MRIKPTPAFAALLVLTLLSSISANAQKAQTPTEGPKPGATVDAWRHALPQVEETGQPVADAAPPSAKTLAETEKELLSRAQGWAEAVRRRDAAALDDLLAEDFTLASVRLPDAQMDKRQFVEAVLREGRSGFYELGKVTVRVYGRTALVTGWLKHQAPAGAVAGPGGDLLFTDLWVKQAGLWKAVSRHESAAPQRP